MATKEFDIRELVESRRGENYKLHDLYMNRTLSTVLKTIGFDKCYARAKGAYLYDAEGNDYLDFITGYGVYGMGRNHPVIAKALKDAVDMDMSNMVQLDCALLSGLLAERLVKLLDNRLTACFFCNSGTEANEGAIKFARAHTKRSRILSMKGGYHGLTYGALSVTATAHFHEGYGPFLPGAEAVNFNDLEDLEAKLKQGDVAAFIAEPVEGHGVYIPSPEFFPKAQELCRKYGALFIMDEVQTGLGRTGKWFAFRHWNLDPDIVTVAKALSGGYVRARPFVHHARNPPEHFFVSRKVRRTLYDFRQKQPRDGLRPRLNRRHRKGGHGRKLRRGGQKAPRTPQRPQRKTFLHKGSQGAWAYDSDRISGAQGTLAEGGVEGAQRGQQLAVHADDSHRPHGQPQNHNAGDEPRGARRKDSPALHNHGQGD